MSDAPTVYSPFRSDLLSGRVAVVTGGGTGIGRAIALQLGAAGARLALCGRRLEPLQAVAAELAALPGSAGPAICASCDIREPAQIAAFVEKVRAELGVIDHRGASRFAIDILINNAGGQRPYPAADMPLEHFERVIRNNLTGTFAMTQAVARAAMIPQRRGAIVNIIANVLRGFPGMAHTGAARAGVDNLTKSLAVEWSQHNIRVNAIAPGTIDSGALGRYPDFLVQMARQQTPLKRLGRPDDIGYLAAFLASDAAAYITGVTCYVDGGASLWGDVYPLPDVP